MKELLKELVKLIFAMLLVFAAFIAFWAFIAFVIKCFEVLPYYVGHFVTTLLYIAFIMLMFAGIKYFADRNER